MAGFDWERFLRSRNYEYARTSSRQVEVPCPFCGPEHANHNVSINLKGHGWKCWRLPHVHYGRSPVGLVKRLANCSEEEARAIVGLEGPPPPPPEDTLADNLARLRGEAKPAVVRRSRGLTLPPHSRPLDYNDPKADPFLAYMEDTRGYRSSEVRWLIETYDLHYAILGDYKWRIIFPVYDRRGDLLTWTARAISKTAHLRYKQPRTEDVRTDAPHTLLGLNRLWTVQDPRVLVVCEGPLDATRISVSGAHLGVWGTCLFGLGLSDAQCTLLDELSSRFPRIAVLLDPGAEHVRLRMARQMFPLQVELPQLPKEADDPGAMTPAQAAQFCMDLTST